MKIIFLISFLFDLNWLRERSVGLSFKVEWLFPGMWQKFDIFSLFFIKKCFCTLANVFVCLGPFNYHAILVFLQHSDLENGPEEVHCVDQVQPGPGWLHRDCCKTVGTNQGQFKQLQSQKSWPCNRKYLKSPYYVYFGTNLIVSNIKLLIWSSISLFQTPFEYSTTSATKHEWLRQLTFL